MQWFRLQENKHMTLQNHTNDAIPQSGRAVIYARPATDARMLSAQRQANTLIELANAQGYPNERIILYEDVGAPARESLVMRCALSGLLKALVQPERAQEPIQAIFVSSEGRLFKDANMVDFARFIEICKERGVTPTTPTSEYDFTNPPMLRFSASASTVLKHPHKQ